MVKFHWILSSLIVQIGFSKVELKSRLDFDPILNMMNEKL